MPSEIVANPFEQVLVLASEWAREQEQRILRAGRCLSPDELEDARAAGVRNPEGVRVLPVEKIPAPPQPILEAASTEANLFPDAPSGLTFQYGIFVRTDRQQDRYLLAHELAHTAQYERLGGVVPFLRDYLTQCTTLGYQNSPLEREANAIADTIAKIPCSES